MAVVAAPGIKIPAGSGSCCCRAAAPAASAGTTGVPAAAAGLHHLLFCGKPVLVLVGCMCC